MTFLSLSPRISFSPGLVEYRLPSGGGARVVRVMRTTTSLRLLAFVDTPGGHQPVAMFEHEYRELFDDARARFAEREKPAPTSHSTAPTSGPS